MINLYEFVLLSCGINVKELRRFHDDFFWEFSGNLQAAYGFRIALVLEDNDPRIEGTMQAITAVKLQNKFIVIKKSDVTKLSMGTWVIEKTNNDWFIKKLNPPLLFSEYSSVTRFLRGVDSTNQKNIAPSLPVFEALKNIYKIFSEGLQPNQGVKNEVNEKVVTQLLQWTGQHQQSDHVLTVLSPRVQEKIIFHQMIAYQLAQLCLQLKFGNLGQITNGDDELKIIHQDFKKIHQALSLFVLNEPSVDVQLIHQTLGDFAKILSIDLTIAPVLPAAVQAVFVSIINKLSADREGITRLQDKERCEHFLQLKGIYHKLQFDDWVKTAPQGASSAVQGTLVQLGMELNHQSYALLVGQIKWEEFQQGEDGIMKACSIVQSYAGLQDQEKLVTTIPIPQIILPDSIHVAYAMVAGKFAHKEEEKSKKRDSYADHFQQLSRIELTESALKAWKDQAPSYFTGKYKAAVQKITLAELQQVRQQDAHNLVRAIVHINTLRGVNSNSSSAGSLLVKK